MLNNTPITRRLATLLAAAGLMASMATLATPAGAQARCQLVADDARHAVGGAARCVADHDVQRAVERLRACLGRYGGHGGHEAGCGKQRG